MVSRGGVYSRFFHVCIKSRTRRNIILTFWVGDTWIEGVFEIHKEVKNYFSNHYKEPLIDLPRLDEVDFPSFSRRSVLVSQTYRGRTSDLFS